jgi:hypothetical protein
MMVKSRICLSFRSGPEWAASGQPAAGFVFPKPELVRLRDEPQPRQVGAFHLAVAVDLGTHHYPDLVAGA